MHGRSNAERWDEIGNDCLILKTTTRVIFSLLRQRICETAWHQLVENVYCPLNNLNRTMLSPVPAKCYHLAI